MNQLLANVQTQCEVMQYTSKAALKETCSHKLKLTLNFHLYLGPDYTVDLKEIVECTLVLKGKGSYSPADLC